MKRLFVRLFPFAAFLLAACGGQSCSCLQPIKGGFPIDGRRHENALQIRVTQGAIDYLGQNGKSLVDSLLPMGSTFDVPASCGNGNEVCCLNGMPAPMCKIMIGVQNFVLTPTPPSVLKFAVTAQLISKDPIPVTVKQGITAKCYFSIDTTKGTNGHKDIDLASDVTFTVDPMTDLTNIELANTKVLNLDESMLDITPQAGLGNTIACGVANFGLIKGFIIGQLTSQLEDQVKSAASDGFCASCKTQDDCDGFADGCMGGKCMRKGKCLQEIGAFGKLDVGAMFASLSPGTKAQMDTLAVLGGYASVTQPANQSGISLGMLGGGQGDPHNTCVPARPAPSVPMVTKWSQELAQTEPASMKPYHVAFGVHESHLNTMAWSAYDAGALCLNVGTPSVALLDSKTVGVLMPSLGDLVHTGDAPMFLVIRPGEEPHIKLGAGTFDVDMNGMKTIKEPLLNVTVPKFAIDFYLWVDERYVRIMTLTTDLTIPVSLDVDGKGQIVPLLGDLAKAFTNVKVTNSELLAESPDKLAKAFPMLLGIAVGQIGGALQPIALPAVMGLNLSLVAIEPTDNLQYLSIFANISLAMADAFHAETEAAVGRVLVPPTAAFSVESGLDPLVAPRVELDLGGIGIDGSDRELEWSASFDGGVSWTPYSRTRRPTLSHATLWLQGRHHVDVRARMVGQPATTDPTPVRLEFLVDTVAPKGTFELAGDEIRFDATDAVTPIGALEYSVDGSEWRRGSTVVRPGGVDPLGVVVKVRDEAGNVGDLEFHGRTTAPSAGGCGCVVGGPAGSSRAALALALVALGGLLARRRRGAALAALLLAAGFGAAACNQQAGRASLPKSELIDAIDEVGRFSDAVAQDGYIHVSGYDDSLGDLAYTEIAVADVDKPVVWQWVDGVPLDSPGEDPMTYRKGITDPGDDVGQYTSLALLPDGSPRIAYLDVTNKQIKLAAASFADRKFSTSVIDKPTAGRASHTSISLDKTGIPSVAYFVTNIPDGMNGFISKLRLATAKVANPGGPGDWTIIDVDQTAIPCSGLCPMGQACVQKDPMDKLKVSSCKPVDAMCPKMCGTGEACIAQACTAVLTLVKAPDVAEGTGLFPQLRRLKSGNRVIAYYDHEQGDAKLAVETAPGQLSKVLIDGMDPLTDVGQYVSMQVAPDDTMHVTYVDAIADRLLYKTVKGMMAAMAPEVVDDGNRMDGPRPIGAGAALWTDGMAVRVVYQDQQQSDLMQAVRGGGNWSKQSVKAGSPGYGFYPHVVSDGSKLYVTQFVYDRASMGAIGFLTVSALP